MHGSDLWYNQVVVLRVPRLAFVSLGVSGDRDDLAGSWLTYRCVRNLRKQSYGRVMRSFGSDPSRETTSKCISRFHSFGNVGRTCHPNWSRCKSFLMKDVDVFLHLTERETDT